MHTFVATMPCQKHRMVVPKCGGCAQFEVATKKLKQKKVQMKCKGYVRTSFLALYLNTSLAK